MPSPTSSLKKRVEHEVVMPNYGSASSSSLASPIPPASPARATTMARLSRCLASEVDASKVTPLLSAYSFMTGYIDAISFSAIFVWVGFQTGNFAQLSLAFARYLEKCFTGAPSTIQLLLQPGSLPQNMPPSEQQAVCSLLAFLIGVFVFGRIGDRIGTHKRVWLVGGTLIQAALTLVSALLFRSLEQYPRAAQSPMVSCEYFLGVACLSASLGVQGFMARRLATQFSTTIVLTTVFVELTTDPTLFHLNRSVQSRDQKWFAVVFVFLGVVTGRLILGQIGTASTLAVAVVLRVVIAFAWLLVPARHIHLP